MSKHLIVIRNQEVVSTDKPKRKSPEPRLQTLVDVRREIASVYRAARCRNEIDAQDASRFVYVLKCLAEVVEATTFEDRLTRLEESNHVDKNRSQNED